MIDELKKNCNAIYAEALDDMENGEEVKSVKRKLLAVAEYLVKIGQADFLSKKVCEEKARNIVAVVKMIETTVDYPKAYFSLTKSALKRKNTEEKTSDAEKKVPGTDASEGTKSAEAKRTEEKQSEEISMPKREEMNIKTPKDFVFNWDEKTNVKFDDVAGLKEVKETVRTKVLLPLTNPELFDGYDKKNGGGVLLYGPPGTGKTMIAAAIAHEINAKFCSIGPSDLLTTGVGNSEKLIATLFKEARSFPCAVIFLDEFESLCPATTHAQHARQIRSELLRQMQGLDAYGGKREGILLLIGATNKPWDVDPAFIRPGRLGTRIYVDLPDNEARRYMLEKALQKVSVNVDDDLDIEEIVEATKGYNGADMTGLMEKVKELSINRAMSEGIKVIKKEDFSIALTTIKSSVQPADVEKLTEWKTING